MPDNMKDMPLLADEEPNAREQKEPSLFSIAVLVSVVVAIAYAVTEN